MKKLGCFLVVFVLCSSVSAFASDLTLYGGAQKQGKITLKNSTSTIAFDPKNFGTFGIRVGIGKKIFGGETTLGYCPNFISTDAKAVVITQDLMIQAPFPKVNPYFAVGLGGIFTKGTGATDIGAKTAIDYGGGLKFFPSGPVGGRLDVRGYAMPSVQNQTLNVLEVTLGVIFRF